jgi:hypothetical protein
LFCKPNQNLFSGSPALSLVDFLKPAFGKKNFGVDGTNARVTGGFPKAGTSFLERVTDIRIFRFSK